MVTNRPVIWTATCTEVQAEELLKWDHHAVTLGGEAGILLTAHWHEAWGEPFEVRVVMHGSASAHPAAPASVNELLADLAWGGAGNHTPGAPPARVAKPRQRRLV